jgi:hypothetical protein
MVAMTKTQDSKELQRIFWSTDQPPWPTSPAVLPPDQSRPAAIQLGLASGFFLACASGLFVISRINAPLLESRRQVVGFNPSNCAAPPSPETFCCSFEHRDRIQLHLLPALSAVGSGWHCAIEDRPLTGRLAPEPHESSRDRLWRRWSVAQSHLKLADVARPGVLLKHRDLVSDMRMPGLLNARLALSRKWLASNGIQVAPARAPSV